MIEEFYILIARDLDGTINVEEKQRLIELCRQNDAYRPLYVQYKGMKSIVQSPFDPDSIDVEAAEQSVMRRIRQETKVGHPSFLFLWQKIAAILLIPLLVATIYLWMSNQQQVTSSSQLHAVTSLPGTRSKVNLPDGSEVWLNSGSTLTYPIAFSKKDRRTMLEGEAYFMVDANPDRPFYITVNDLEVMVTGTELNVNGYRDDSLHQVILTSGSATVTAAGNKSIQLEPDQCFSLNTLTGQTTLFTTDAVLYGKWKEGVLAFRDETLENVFKRIGRTFNVDIRVADARLAVHKYRATFEDESLPQILDAIKLSAPIRYKYIRESEEGRSSEIIEVYYD